MVWPWCWTISLKVQALETGLKPRGSGAVGGSWGSVRQLMAKGCKRENDTFSATTPTPLPQRRFRLPRSINTRTWGQFWINNSLGKPLPKFAREYPKERKRERPAVERENRVKAWLFR
ncbi:hypothetical protein IGI04_007080 [Brassica rapa subsp. trilocularis]|uniref:Uncharacterized protein n=1 Tax=Brassica rapa subsp. trilocularis TaxID=1813537 RepID=A0ABQ7NIP9_BRACM|nr:hypothetical protein IGI04_007080 [Brassica rapa subsp. trilocularis]